MIFESLKLLEEPQERTLKNLVDELPKLLLKMLDRFIPSDVLSGQYPANCPHSVHVEVLRILSMITSYGLEISEDCLIKILKKLKCP